MHILCFIFGHDYHEWISRPRNLLVRACSRCGKSQYQTGNPDGRLYWIDEERSE